MRGYIHWANAQGEYEAEVHSTPPAAPGPYQERRMVPYQPPQPPAQMTDRQFALVIVIAVCLALCVITVAALVVVGFAGLLFSGMMDVFAGAILAGFLADK